MKKKKFATLRSLNRKRNYLMKYIRYYLSLLLEKFLWDKRKKTAIDFSSVKSILILRNEGKIGDVIIDTAIIKVLSQHNYAIDMLVTSANKSILEYNKNIRNTYVIDNISFDDFMKKRTHNISDDALKQLKENDYDLIIDPTMFNVPIHRLKLLNQISAKNVISFNKKRWLKHYSYSIDFDYNSYHMKKSNELLLSMFNIENKEINYDLHYPKKIEEEVEFYLSTLPRENKTVVLNIFAGSDERCLSLEQAQEIDEKLSFSSNKINLIILDYKNEIPSNIFKNAKIYNPATLQHTISLISKADLIISPDTSIVHIAATYQKPLIAIYKDAIHNNILWAPGYTKAEQIFVSHTRTYQDKDIVNQIISSAKNYL